MSENNEETNSKKCCSHSYTHHGEASAVYGMGLIGAVIYFISTATGFWVGVLGILKAIFWPAFLVYGLLKFLVM